MRLPPRRGVPGRIGPRRQRGSGSTAARAAPILTRPDSRPSPEPPLIPSTDQLVEHAIAASGGLEDYGESGWREGLDVLADSVRREADLNPAGEGIYEWWIGVRLRNRLAVTDWVKRHPAIAAQRVERPLFVLGMLRTGTTLLCELLAQDPAHRPLWKWEALACVPPPRTADFASDPRLAAMREEVERTYGLAPELAKIHYEPADGPTECVPVLGQHFRSQDYIGLWRVPSYNAWYETCDMRSAYRYHASVLRLLQSEAPGRWSLKAPGHMYHLDALLETYPDARLVVTHRDPARTVGSTVSMMKHAGGRMLTDSPWDPYTETTWRDIPLHMVEALMRFRDRRPDVPIHDFRYEDLVRDPIAAVRGLYGFFGDVLSDEAARRMRAHLAASPQHGRGRHEYALADFGLTAEGIRERFAEYVRRYDVPAEGA